MKPETSEKPNYLKIAKEQHNLIMLILKEGSNGRRANKELVAYANRALTDKAFLKLMK